MKMEGQIKLVLFYGSAFAFTLLLTLCIFLISISKTYAIIQRTRKEKEYFDQELKTNLQFPTLHDLPSVYLSVIIPAYNEEERLPPMLEECIKFLDNYSKKKNFKYEIILVSDGSTDGTVEIGNKYSLKLGSEKFRVLPLEFNRGKGGAVRLGVLSARGSIILFADADGATKFADFVKLEASVTKLCSDKFEGDSGLSDQLGISIGSRAHLEKDAVAERNFFRTVLMYGFHFLVWLFAVKGIKDTQCGFKLFTRKAAVICFESMHVERWAFDVELLYIAKKMKIPIEEIAVNWTEIEGSKITPVWSWIQMGFDLGLIWLRYTIGAWKIKPEKND